MLPNYNFCSYGWWWCVFEQPLHLNVIFFVLLNFDERNSKQPKTMPKSIKRAANFTRLLYQTGVCVCSRIRFERESESK